MCSTPFGINGRNTARPRVRCRMSPCAQRLSASTEGTPQSANFAAPPRWCSTPFGINGRNTDRSGCRLRSSQRCSTPFGINGRNTHGSTYSNSMRLTCSTPFGINGRNTRTRQRGSRRACCAQRLSASTEGTREHDNEDRGVLAVLNAFRHQRKEHRGRSTSARMASCAQRLSASTEGTQKLTPAMQAMLKVLNAFRHQRKEHAAWFDCGAHPDVLNAFRHQRKEHTPSTRPRPRATCAQRLSASTEGTLVQSL